MVIVRFQPCKIHSFTSLFYQTLLLVDVDVAIHDVMTSYLLDPCRLTTNYKSHTGGMPHTQNIRHKFHMFSSIRDLFQKVDYHTDINFIKETSFYNLI